MYVYIYMYIYIYVYMYIYIYVYIYICICRRNSLIFDIKIKKSQRTRCGINPTFAANMVPFHVQEPISSNIRIQTSCFGWNMLGHTQMDASQIGYQNLIWLIHLRHTILMWFSAYSGTTLVQFEATQGETIAALEACSSRCRWRMC